MLDKFMHEWLYVSDYDVPVDNNGFKGRAKMNGVDLEEKYIALVGSAITGNLPEWRLAFNLGKNKRVYVMRPKQEAEFLANLPKNTYVGVGKSHFDLSGSIKEAIFSLMLTSKFDPVVHYDEVTNMYNIVRSSLDYPSTRKKMNQVDEDTQITFWLYTKSHVSLSTLAEMLMIHPKTVKYRLQKIKAITGLDPKKGIDLLPLTVAYLREKTENLDILETELQSYSDDMLPRDKTISVTVN